MKRVITVESKFEEDELVAFKLIKIVPEFDTNIKSVGVCIRCDRGNIPYIGKDNNKYNSCTLWINSLYQSNETYLINQRISKVTKETYERSLKIWNTTPYIKVIDIGFKDIGEML